MQIQEPIVVDVDIKKASYINQPQVTQNDSNTFLVNVFDNGEPIDLSNVTTVTIAHTRLDRKVIVTGGTVVEGTNQVKFVVDRPETSITGRVDAIIQLYNADSRISTLAFNYKVNSDPTNNYIPSESERTLIEVVLNDGPLRIQEAIEATENANVATESANIATTEAVAQANYAKAQGDYAKVEASNLGQLKSDVDSATQNAMTATANTNAAIANANASAMTANSAATNADTKAAQLEARVNAAIATTTNSAEIVDARGTHTTLKNRLDATDAQFADTSRESAVLGQGIAVITSEDTLAEVEIEGRTLVPMQNNVLDPLKYYVLADKKTKLKWADTTTTAGVAKFTAKAEKPGVVRVANFENKVAGSTVENPHIARRVGTKDTLQPPTGIWAELTNETGTTSQGYGPLMALGGAVSLQGNPTNGIPSQQMFSFNLLEEVERNIGRIPRATTADKVQWLKDNLAKLVCNWHGYGFSVGGNKATLGAWNVANGAWSVVGTNTNASSLRLTFTASIVSNSVWITSDGFLHLIAYAEPSDGVTGSNIYTDYVELEIELKPEAILHDPRVPLYEVPDDEYNKILVDWDATEVKRRYPAVQGTQHLQNPYILAEGENLLPPFTEWTLHANAKLISPYELELNATGNTQDNKIEVPLIAGQIYNIKSGGTQSAYITHIDSSGATLSSGTGFINGNFNIPANAVKTRISLGNGASGAGTWTWKQPMLTLGSTPKPFVPRNPSYLFADVKLGQISTVKDTLFKQDGRWKIRKVVEKDVVLDGSLAWNYFGTKTGIKIARLASLLNPSSSHSIKTSDITKYNGTVLQFAGFLADNILLKDQYIFRNDVGVYVSISNDESGLPEDISPSPNQLKAYFNGWKYTGDGTTHSWVSIIDGTTLPAEQTTTYVAATKAPNYTPYKLSYQLATPQIVDVTDKVEGDIKLNGLAQVTIDAGYRRTVVDGKSSWTKGTKTDFTTNPLSVKMTYANNIRSAFNDTISKVEDNTTMLSVHEKAIIDLYVRVKALEVK